MQCKVVSEKDEVYIQCEVEYEVVGEIRVDYG